MLLDHPKEVLVPYAYSVKEEQEKKPNKSVCFDFLRGCDRSVYMLFKCILCSSKQLWELFS